MDGSGIQVTISRSPRQAVVSPVGELDLATCPQLIEAVRQVLLRPPPRLIIDFSKVAFCASTGVGSLITIRKSAAAVGSTLSVTNVGDRVYRVFVVAGVAAALNATTASA